MANNKNEEIYNASGCIDTTAYKALKNIPMWASQAQAQSIVTDLTE